MKASMFGFFAFVLLAASVTASPAEKKDVCQKSCSADYTPICGKSPVGKPDITFGNVCVLANFNCGKKDEAYIKSGEGECPGKAPVRLS